MHNHCINKLLNIEEVIVKKVVHADTFVEIHLETMPKSHGCAKCYPLQKTMPTPPTVPLLITKTMQKIEESFPAFIGLNALAAHCGCSVTHLTQTFRQYTGKSIHTYLTQRRLEHARRLLQNGASVTDACYQSGFSDCSGFISLFKKHFQVTPGKYKNQ